MPNNESDHDQDRGFDDFLLVTPGVPNHVGAGCDESETEQGDENHEEPLQAGRKVFFHGTSSGCLEAYYTYR